MSAQQEILFYKSQVDADRTFLEALKISLEQISKSSTFATSDAHWFLLATIKDAGVPEHRVLPILHRFLSRTADEDVRNMIWASIEVWEYYNAQKRPHKIDQQIDNMRCLFDPWFILGTYRPADGSTGFRDTILAM